MRQKILALLQKGKSEKSIILILSANQDQTLDKLKDLLSKGFNKVTWRTTEPYCRICQDLDEKEWSLKDFIHDLDHDAPIFEHSHVNCDCEIVVSNNDGDEIVLNWEGDEL